MKTEARVLPVFLVTTALVILIWLCFAPGFMSYDSAVQYQMALDQHYVDSNPVIMSFVWHLCLAVISGPQSLLVLHLAILALGIASWHSNLAHRSWSALVPALFFLPWIINFAGVLWKDVGMAFCLLLGCGLLFNRRKNGLTALAAVPFIFYATAVRHNAILAIAPVIYCAVLYHRPSISHLKTALITATLVTALPLAASFLSYNVLHAEKKHFETFLMGDEIVKISSITTENRLPWVKTEDIQTCALAPILYERALCFIGRGYDPSGSLVVNQPYQSVHALWRETVLAHPVLYLRIRLEAYLYFLRAPDMAPYYIWQPGMTQNRFHDVAIFHPKAANWLEHYVRASTLVLSEPFKPYIWLLLTIGMLIQGFRMKGSPERMQVIALNASSASYLIGYLPTVPSADFRYIYWCVIATTLSIIVVIIRNRKIKAPTHDAINAP